MPIPRPQLAPPRFEYRTVTKYRTEWRIDFKEVSRTVTRRVPETVMKEVRETVPVPHWREETRQRTVMVPATRLETRESPSSAPTGSGSTASGP